jgi:hypothetical protein
MVRQVQVTVKNQRADYVLEVLRSENVASLCMGVVHFPGPTHTLILLKCVEKRLFVLLQELEGVGIGETFGTVDVLQVVTTKPLIRSNLRFNMKKKRNYRISDRMPVEEIYEAIDAESHLTFNFITLVVFAAMISGLGLATNSDATVRGRGPWCEGKGRPRPAGCTDGERLPMPIVSDNSATGPSLSWPNPGRFPCLSH